MKEINELEERVWTQIADATERRDPAPIRDLTGVAEELDQLKKDAEKIDAAVEKIRAKVEAVKAPQGTTPTTNSVTWKVSPWDIRGGVLSIEEPKKAGLIPNNGHKFKIKTSIGQFFHVELKPGKDTLAAGNEIRDFYAGENVKAGDRLIWTKTDDLEFSLEKG